MKGEGFWREGFGKDERRETLDRMKEEGFYTG
jgi:hypothetical protein